MLLCARQVIRCGVSAKVLLKATLISGSRLGCFTYGWLTLLEFMVQFMWIVELSCSARMAFLTPFSMLRISECWLCLCQNAKFEALQHAPSLVISWLCTSLSMSYLVRTGLAARHRHSCGRTYRQVPAGHRSVCACACAHTHTHTHTHTHPHTHTHTRLAQAWFWRRLLASAGHIWAGSSCLFWLNLARLGGDYDSWCRRYDGGMCYLLEVSLMSLVVLAIRLALFFMVTHTCARVQKHTPDPGGDSPRRVTRAWDSCLFFGRTLLDMVMMCDVHVSIVVLAAGLALSLHCDLLASYLIICLSWPHGSWIFFWRNLVRRGGDLHLLMSVIWRSCAWKYQLSCFKCHLPGTLFSLSFTCSMHTPLFRNLP